MTTNTHTASKLDQILWTALGPASKDADLGGEWRGPEHVDLDQCESDFVGADLYVVRDCDDEVVRRVWVIKTSVGLNPDFRLPTNDELSTILQ